MKFKLLLVLAIIIANTSEAKKKKSNSKDGRYIKGISTTYGTEIGNIKAIALYNRNNVYDPINGTYKDVYTFQGIKKPVNATVMSLGMVNHFIVKKLDKNRSISINFSPSVGISFVQDRMFNYTLPLFLQFNLGNLSTYETRKDKGFTIGLGFEYINAGIINKSVNGEDYSDRPYDLGYDGYKFLQPAMNIGYRFYNSNQVAREINLKYGVRSTETHDVIGLLPSDKKSTMNHWFKLSAVRYIGY